MNQPLSRPKVCEVWWYYELHHQNANLRAKRGNECTFDIPAKERPMVVLAIDERNDMLVYPLTTQASGSKPRDRWIGPIEGTDRYMKPLPDKTNRQLVNQRHTALHPVQVIEIARKCVDRALVLMPLEMTETALDRFDAVLDIVADSPA